MWNSKWPCEVVMSTVRASACLNNCFCKSSLTAPESSHTSPYTSAFFCDRKFGSIGHLWRQLHLQALALGKLRRNACTYAIARV